MEAPGLKWARRFEQYDTENPDIWEQFKRFAFEMLHAGRKRLSTNLIIYRIRFETAVHAADGEWKVNSAYGPSYARKFMAAYPRYEGVFELRERAA